MITDWMPRACARSQSAYFQLVEYITGRFGQWRYLSIHWLIPVDILQARDVPRGRAKAFHIAYTIPKRGAVIGFDMLAIARTNARQRLKNALKGHSRKLDSLNVARDSRLPRLGRAEHHQSACVYLSEPEYRWPDTKIREENDADGGYRESQPLNTHLHIHG